ncbi:protein kinase domain-containing protein [Streptomyces lavendulae]|uniref:protein kinase domain-containing protein n=1 Tax=Streptomyces lavendulae TaxID=1914 RepID=UPI0031E5244E
MTSGGFAVRVGDRLADRYRLDQRLGAGGMGEVWRGHDLALDRAVAVKVLLEAATNEELIARFRREATIGARLQHPGITVVHDVGQHEGRLFIVMELLSGEDLGAVLARERGGLPAAVAVDLAAQTAEALAAAHERAVVHRDLKPGNLFLLPGGRLKICDFGIAHSADATAGWTVTGRMFGTPPYMAPEQWRGEHVDARCDLYALGCVLYALLSGEPPFGSAEPMYVLMRRHVEDAPLSLREAGVAVARELDRLVLALLAKAPADRPESAEAVAKALRNLPVAPGGAGTGTPAPPGTPPRAGTRAGVGAGGPGAAGAAAAGPEAGAPSGARTPGDDQAGPGPSAADDGPDPNGAGGEPRASGRPEALADVPQAVDGPEAFGTMGWPEALNGPEADGPAGRSGAGDRPGANGAAGGPEGNAAAGGTVGVPESDGAAGRAEAPDRPGAGRAAAGDRPGADRAAGGPEGNAAAGGTVGVPESDGAAGRAEAPNRPGAGRAAGRAEAPDRPGADGATGRPEAGGFGLGEGVWEVVRELLVEAEETLVSLPPGAGEVRTEGLALAAEAAARFDAGLAGRLLDDAELWAWTDGDGDGARVAALLTGLARRISRDAPRRTERILTAAQQALFTVSGPARASRLRKVAEELAAVAPERGVRLAERHFAGSPAEEAVLARAVLASAPADPARAERYLARIRSAAVRAATESKSVTAVARHDLAAALRLAGRVPAGGARVRALCRVAGERSAVGDRAGTAEALGAAERALAELPAGTGDEEVEAARAALEAARELDERGHGSVLRPAGARERAAAARGLAGAAERGRELAWIARDCTAGAPWLAGAASDPGTPPPHSVAVTLSPASRLPVRPAPPAGPGAERWRAPVRPESVHAAGEAVVWAAGAEVGVVGAATGAARWTAWSDEGVAAPPLPEPERVWCAADADTVCVVVESGGAPGGRLVVREPSDGRVRWWRELDRARPGTPLTLTGALVLWASEGGLTALRKATGEPAWRHPLAGDGPRTVTVAGECLVLGDGRQLRALHLPSGVPLWSWPRGYGAGGGDRAVPDVPAGAVPVLDGGVVRALDRRRGYELWRFDPGAPAARLLSADGVVYVAAYRAEQGWDVVFALDAGTGAVRWQRPVTRHDGPDCALELLGVRRGVLHVRSVRGGRRGLLGRTPPPFVTGLELDGGKPRWQWEHAALAVHRPALTPGTLALPLPELTGIALP